MNEKLQIVCAGPAQFGIPAEEISAIVPWREPAPLPYAPRSVLGIVSIEGRMLTVLDLARLQWNDDEANYQPRPLTGYIVGLRGDEQLALAVDSVSEKIELEEADSLTQPEVTQPLLIGVLHRAGAEIGVLNLKEVFPLAIHGHERRRRRF
jgi:chemotaxis signal transduction protein